MPRRADQPGSARRMVLLDGLRGVAIVLVVLSHGWVVWPTDWIDDNGLSRALFRSGNFAVTIFLFAAGYFAYKVLAGPDLRRGRIGVGFVRRLLRVAPITLVVLPVILVAGAFDDSDTTSSHVNATSLYYILTYRWNWYLQTDLADARWDLGHLWYLSVDLQAFVFMAMVMYLLRRRPVGLILTLLGLFTLFTWWRMHVSEVEDPLFVLLRTTARIDAFIAGVLLAASLALLTRMASRPDSRLRIEQSYVKVAGVVGLTGVVVMLWYCSHDEHYLAWGVTTLEVSLVLLVGAAALGGPAADWFSHPLLTLLGRNSLPLYVWHYPVFAAVQRNSLDWAWGWRTVVALALTVALCIASHYLVERRVTRLLAHPGWRRTPERAALGQPTQMVTTSPESNSISRVAT